MRTTTARRMRFWAGAGVLATGAALLLSGCSSPQPADSPSPVTHTTEMKSAEKSAKKSASPQPAAQTFTCADLQPEVQQAIAALDPGLQPDSSYQPAAGSYGATIVQLGGTACGWSDAANGTTVSVAFGQVATPQLQQKVAAASTPTDILGSGDDVTAYVANSGGTASGDIEVFTEGGSWVSAVSPRFTTPSAATELLQDVLQAQPS